MCVCMVQEILKPSKEDLIRKQLSRIVERLTTSTLVLLSSFVAVM